MKVDELTKKTPVELQTELKELLTEQFKLRVQKAAGEMSQKHQFRRVRRDIARVKTVLNQLKREGSKS